MIHSGMKSKSSVAILAAALAILGHVITGCLGTGLSISVAPSQTVPAGKPMRFTCQCADPTSFNTSLSLLSFDENFGLTKRTIAQGSNTYVEVLPDYESRVEATFADNCTLLVYYSSADFADSAFYQCVEDGVDTNYGDTISVTVIFVDESSSNVPTDHLEVGNSNSSETSTDGGAKNTPTSYNVVISVAVISTSISVGGIVFLLLRIRFGSNCPMMFVCDFNCLCKCDSRCNRASPCGCCKSSSRDNANATVETGVANELGVTADSEADKPPNYDDIVIMEFEPPNYDSVVATG